MRQMDLPKKFARRGIVLFLQIAAAVVSLLLGLAEISKESAPLVKQAQENYQQAEAVRKASQIAQMNIPWQYQGNDGTWRYYSDPNQRYWCRVNIQGVYEYCEYPQLASVPQTIR